MNRKYKYTEEEFKLAVAQSYSYAETARKLNIVAAGGNYITIKTRIKLLNLDISHWTGQGHLRGKTHDWSAKRPLSEILVEHSNYTNSSVLRQRLLKEELLLRRCNFCNQTHWMNRLIPLELHHKNGIRSDNRLENLELLCPNCHSLTENYRGKNIHKSCL